LVPLHLTLLERLLGRLNLLPAPLLDTPLGAGIARALVVACDHGVFDALSAQPLTMEALTESLHCSQQGLQILLQLLVSAGYVQKRQGRYANSRIARRWLCSDSPLNIAPYIIHSPDIVAIWDHLPEVVREGKQVMRMPYEDSGRPEAQAALARHYAGLASLAMVLGRELVLRVRLPENARQLLDVGGSHAAYSVLFCRKYPNIHATIIDMQEGIEAGKRTALQTGLSEHLSFVRADIVRDNFTNDLGSYDVALYFHIAHLLSPVLNAELLAKVAKTLRPGGMLIFVDQVTDQAHRSHLTSLMVQLMALTMATVGGTCYPFPTVKHWLDEAGMEQVRNHRLLTPGVALITARKKS
jgi:2-polyprenyl-3-methyl-5-hydroxy-6-metoxy-1,4-benzoquinol methylase